MARHAGWLGFAVLCAAISCSTSAARKTSRAPERPPPHAPVADAGLASDAAGPTPTPPPPIVTNDFMGIGQRLVPNDPTNLCEPAQSNVDRAARAILALPRPAPGASVAVQSQSQSPEHLARLKQRYALSSRELALLGKNGFAVMARLEERTYADAFHEIYRSELPLYVGVDAVFHAVFNGHDTAAGELELSVLAPLQNEAIDAMHGALLAAAAQYPREVAADADLYLAVARSLGSDALVGPVLGPNAAIAAIVKQATDAAGFAEIELFGRRRKVDFSRYQPRGRYAKRPELMPYFRAATWLANLELNLVSRGGRSSQPGFVPNPSETPREALLALALADLARRSKVEQKIAQLDAAWQGLGGLREDVSLADLGKLRKKAKIGSLTDSDAFDRLKAAIGSDYARTTRIHYMPQGSRPLPAISTLLGPRITPDTTAIAGLVHGDVSSRFEIRAGDIGVLLGHDVARKLLSTDLARFPELDSKLGDGRALLARTKTDNLYGGWLMAIRALADAPEGALPSYTKTRAFAEHRLGSALVAYGQLRHDYVLVAGQAYDEGGCVVPDGFVDPVPAVYAALGRYAERGKVLAHSLGSKDVESYFERLRSRLEVLEAIAHLELSGKPLPEEAKRWLSMVVEIAPPTSDSPGSYDGWYFDLFFRRYDAFESPAFVSDFYASTSSGRVTHLGASLPRIGLFVVDVGGSPRVVVGPVARGFELLAQQRITRPTKAIRDPWNASHTAPAPPEPRLALRIVDVTTTKDKDSYVIALRGPAGARIELFDHHRRPIGAGTATGSRLAIDVESGQYPEALRVSLGGFSYFRELRAGALYASVTLGGAKEIEVR